MLKKKPSKKDVEKLTPSQKFMQFNEELEALKEKYDYVMDVIQQIRVRPRKKEDKK